MNGAVSPPRNWLPGAGVVTLAHAAAVAGAIWLGMGKPVVRPAEPVVLIDLPPLAAAAPAAPASASAQPPSAPPAPVVREPVAAPPVAAPLPRAVVAVPPPAPAPAPAAAPARISAPAPAVANPQPARPAPVQTTQAQAGSGASPNDGDNPRAKAQEANYFAQLSAHLNKRKRYPTEAKKARQQGVVTVRFTVHADGSVTGSSIRKSSGHELLDAATLDLLQRVSPLPKFPKSMTKPSVTLSLPIDYSLQTS